MITKLMILLCLAVCLTLIGCGSRKSTPAGAASTDQSATQSVTRNGPQGASPIPCRGGGAAGPMGPCGDGTVIMQVCANCEADSGYPTSANQYGWWCSNNFDEAVKMLGFGKNCKVTRVVSQEECCNHSWK